MQRSPFVLTICAGVRCAGAALLHHLRPLQDGINVLLIHLLVLCRQRLAVLAALLALVALEQLLRAKAQDRRQLLLVEHGLGAAGSSTAAVQGSTGFSF